MNSGPDHQTGNEAPAQADIKVLYDFHHAREERVPGWLHPVTSAPWYRVLRQKKEFDLKSMEDDITSWMNQRLELLPKEDFIPYTEEHVRQAISTKNCGVYFIRAGSEIVYVGKAVELRQRLRWHIHSLPGLGSSPITYGVWHHSKLQVPYEKDMDTGMISRRFAWAINHALYSCLMFRFRVHEKGLHDLEEAKAIYSLKPKWNTAGIYPKA